MKGKLKDINKEFILQWLSENKTLTSLGENLGVTKSHICNHARELGVKVKNGRPKGTPMSQEQKDYFSIIFKGKGNPFYKKNHTQNTKRRMSKNHADFSGENNPFKKSLDANPEKREKLSKRVKNWWASLSKERKKELSKKNSEAQSKIIKNFKMPRSESGYFIGLKCGKIFYRSSWELEFAKFLEKEKKVISFSLESMCIKYRDKNQILKTTRIDFLIHLKNKRTLMVEVKPKALINFKNNFYKIEAQRKHCREMKWIHGILSSKSEKDMREIINL